MAMRPPPASIWEARQQQRWLGRTLRLPTRFEMSGPDIGSGRELVWRWLIPFTIVVALTISLSILQGR